MGWVGRSFGRFETGEDALRKVLDRLGDPPKDLGRVDGPSRRSGAGWGTLPEVRDGSGDPPKGPGWVWGPSRWFETGREVLRKVRNGSVGPLGVCDRSEDPFRDLGRV